MTAIDEFDRLEAMGLWRETADAQRKEVVVSFGKASLVLSDINNRPLTHWSLAAIKKIEREENDITYTADLDGGETLTINDPLMNDAIRQIQNRIARARPKQGRLRFYISAAAILVFLLAAVFWFPNAVTRYAANLMPPAKAQEIGDAVLDKIVRVTGTNCSSPGGERALRRLEARTLNSADWRISIVDLGAKQSLLLPGGHILLNRALAAQEDGPATMAGYALLEESNNTVHSPVAFLFQTIGLKNTLRFLGNGEISDEALEDFADRLMLETPPKPDTGLLGAGFKRAEISPNSFAQSAKLPTLIEGENAAPSGRPILSDNDWISLQEICET